MKLTQTIRDAFVRAAMDEVPNVDYDTQIRELALKAVVETLPDAARKAWDDPDSTAYIQTGSKLFGGIYVNVPLKDRYESNSKIADKYTEQLNELGINRKAQIDRNNELQSKLTAVARSASTRKQLAEMLPEFEKYLPASEPAALRTVPVVQNVVADFAKAGWPKGKQQAKQSESAEV